MTKMELCGNTRKNDVVLWTKLSGQETPFNKGGSPHVINVKGANTGNHKP